MPPAAPAPIVSRLGGCGSGSLGGEGEAERPALRAVERGLSETARDHGGREQVYPPSRRSPIDARIAVGVPAQR